MRGRRADSEDRSPVDDPEPDPRDGAVAGGSAPHAPDRDFPWWGWREHVEDLDPSVRALAETIALSVEGRASADDVERSVVDRSEASLEETWSAVSRLHRSLDDSGDVAPDGELDEARARLDRAAGRLWSAGAEAEIAGVRDFVGEVAHDLRSPLHSILFLTDALFREESGSLTRTQKRQVSVVHSAAAALLRMSNDLLDFSGPDEEVDPDGIAEIPFSPAQVVGDLESLLEPVAHHHEARLHTEVENRGSRVGDPQILNRVLLNLASNALEAVGEKGTVRVRVGGDRERLQTAVEDDSGHADLEKLRALVEAETYSGAIGRLGGRTSGLGLVICGRLVRAVDGRLRVERTDDGWTRFTVSLPFPAMEAEA